MGWCHLPPERVKLTVNTKKELGWAAVVYPLKESKTNTEWTPRKKQTAGSRWAKGQDGLSLFTPWKSQNGPRVKMGCCCLPPDRVKLTVNSKKNKRQGQNGPRILWWKSAVKTIESNWAKRSQVGPDPFWLRVKLGQGVKMGRNTKIICYLTSHLTNNNLTCWRNFHLVVKSGVFTRREHLHQRYWQLDDYPNDVSTDN